MKREIIEININVELNDDVSVELEFDCINNHMEILKVTDIEEKITEAEEFFDTSVLTTSDFSNLSEEEITDAIIAALAKDTFKEVEIEIVFSDGTEVKFKIDGEEDEEDD
ncbi:hypothetical protein [Alkalihalobacillus pseudalcaliphilus]|uniref:hypothetical protein n=1 Tax=Alkalihalobacillus pseudalcaliphilus TaxID=79884 RepID=UPI00064DC9A3|nr:hypothetical protein [Alkalihalobacillus pseudalcaliphilus]KMK77322.1 hypothetical protein AB990_07190 [Alkalihalobacillus pseudalcaliphilus]